MNLSPTCSVIGCSKPTAAFLQVIVPLDDGSRFALNLPQAFCAECREDVRRRADAMTDELWEKLQELLPAGRKGDRAGVDVTTVDAHSPPPPPPEIRAALDRLMIVIDAFSRMQGGGPVRARAAADMADRARRCGAVLRNFPGPGDPERRAAADAFDDFAGYAHGVAQALFRNELETANENLREMSAALQKCQVLVGSAMFATPAAGTPPDA